MKVPEIFWRHEEAKRFCENILCNQRKALFHKIKREWFFSKLKKTWNFSKIFFKTWRNRKVFEKYSLTVPEKFWEFFFSWHEWTGKFPRNILRKFQKISENFSFEDMKELETFPKSYFESLQVLENFREIFF